MKRTNLSVLAQLVVVLASPDLSYAQKDCGKKLVVSQDRITGRRTILTETFKIYVPVGKHLLNILGNRDKDYDYNLTSNFLLSAQGTNYLAFTHTAARAYSSEIAAVLLRLANDTVITLRGGRSIGATRAEYSDWEATTTLFPFSEQNQEYLKRFDIAVVRVVFASQSPTFEKPVDTKKAAEFRNLALCFSEKAPRSIPDASTHTADGTESKATPQLFGAEVAPSMGRASAAMADSMKAVWMVVGRYNRIDKSNGDYFELNRSATFSLLQDGQAFVGTFTVRGDSLSLRKSSGQTAKVHLAGNTLTGPTPPAIRASDDHGTIWERPAQGQKVTLDQIILMIRAKLPDDVIISTIEKSGSKFDLPPESLIRLKTAGASDAVLRAIAK